MVKPDVSPLLDAFFDDATSESECPFIKEIVDAFESDSLWPKQLFESGEAAKRLNHVAFAAFCEVLEAQQDLEEGQRLQKLQDLRYPPPSTQFEEDEAQSKENRGIQGKEKGKLVFEEKGKLGFEEVQGKSGFEEVQGKGKGKLTDLGKEKVQDEEVQGVEKPKGKILGGIRAKGGRGRKRTAADKSKRFRVKFLDLPPRQIVCALPMMPSGCSSGPPEQKRWKKVEWVDGNKVKRVMPARRVRVGGAETSGGQEDPIDITSGSSSDDDSASDDSSSSNDDDSTSQTDASDVPDDWPDVVNGIDISHWNPWVRVFMEALGGVPFIP